MPTDGEHPIELRAWAVRLVLDLKNEAGSLSEACQRIGAQFHVDSETLCGWVTEAQRDAEVQGPHTTTAVKSELPNPNLIESTNIPPSSAPNHRRWRTVSADLRAVIIAAIAAGATAVVGVAHIPWLALLLASTGVAAVAGCVTRAIEETKLVAKVRWLQVSVALSLLFPAGAWAYHDWWDPATHIVPTYPLVVNGDEVHVVALYGEAGGEPQIIATGPGGQNGLIGGQTYNFECTTVGRDGAVWLRYHRFGQVWWAQRAALHVPAGTPAPQIPHC
jgi:transposase-like protein